MKYFSLFIFQLLILKFITCDKLRFVFSLFRHGARSPSKSLDDNNIDIFGNVWEGDGQLTAVGMRQQYLVGYKNNKKYFDKLNITNYNPSEINVFSTDRDRTIMSAYSQLLGIFPPSTSEKLKPEQLDLSDPPLKNFDYSSKKNFLKNDAIQSNINVIPVHIFDKSAMYFNLQDPKICPQVNDFVEKNKQSIKYLNFTENVIKIYGEKILKILNKTDTTFLKDYRNIVNVFDTFISIYFDGRDFSKFTSAGINIEQFYNLSIEFFKIDEFNVILGDKDSYIARMSFSPVLEYLLNLMDSRILLDKNKTDIYNALNPKILLYSAHDTNLSAMEVFLKYIFGDRIQLHYSYFASSLNYELYKNESLGNAQDLESQFYLNILFNEENIFNGPIKYTEFKEMVKKNLISSEEIKSFCNFNSFNDYTKKRTVLMCVLLILIISMLTLIWFIFKKITSKMEDKNGLREISI